LAIAGLVRLLSSGRKLNRNSSSRRTTLARSQVTALFRFGRIKTTITKAKNLQPFVEKLITTARHGDAVQEAFIELVNDED